MTNRAGATGTSPVLEVFDLHCAYGGLRSVDGVSFTVEPRSVVALVGPNGAGKTTLLNAISGLIGIVSGTVRLAGQDMTKLPPWRRARMGLARTFQMVHLFEDLRVSSNVQLGQVSRGYPDFLSALFHLPSHEKYERATEALALAALRTVGLGGMARRPAARLSHGQGRRVELARALVADPILLLLDEPTSGLHAGIIGELVPIIRGAAAKGAAIILVEHNLKFVGEVADRVIVLDYGRIIADGRPEDVVHDPDVVAAYLGGGPRRAKAGNDAPAR
jgi:ABC-type branched-subunit amino acid transport system ATPase component